MIQSGWNDNLRIVKNHRFKIKLISHWKDNHNFIKNGHIVFLGIQTGEDYGKGWAIEFNLFNFGIKFSWWPKSIFVSMKKKI